MNGKLRGKVFGVLILSLSLMLLFGCAKNIETEIPVAGCLPITGMPGAEDFAYIEARNILVVSSCDRRSPEDVDGKLYWINLSLPPEREVANLIDIIYPEGFKPHGVSFVPSGRNGTLYVISHPGSEGKMHTVEVFSYTGRWSHVETLTSDLLTSPNDLVALPDGTFFVSNDFGGGGNTLKKVYALLHIKSGNVTYYDGSEFIDLGNPESYGNGITYAEEEDGEYIYRAALMNRSIKKFKIEREDGKVVGLTYVSKVKINSMPDNLEIDGDGNIFTAAHYNSFTFLKHSMNSAEISPTQVFKVTPAGEVTELYADKGGEISAGSVGRVINGRLYIGQVFGDYVLSCPCEE